MKDITSFESVMDLCNTPLSISTELFLWGTLERAGEKSSCHDKAIWKVVLMDKGQKTPVKLRFTHLARRRQSAKCSDTQSFRTCQGRALPPLALRLLPLPANGGRGRISEGSLLLSQLQVGGIVGWQWSRGLDGEGFSFRTHLSVSAHAPQEVDKMLQKGTFELVDHPGQTYYNWLFLVQVLRGWLPRIDLSGLNEYIIRTKSKMEIVSTVLGSVKKGDSCS